MIRGRNKTRTAPIKTIKHDILSVNENSIISANETSLISSKLESRELAKSSLGKRYNCKMNTNTLGRC